MNLIEKCDILRYLSDLALKEADLIWNRYQAMLLSSTGLVAVFAYSVDKHLRWACYFTAFIGITLAISWFQIHRLSQFYYQRWQLDADALIKSDNELSTWIKGRLAPRLSRPSKLSASGYAHILPVAFIISWVLVIGALAMGLM